MRVEYWESHGPRRVELPEKRKKERRKEGPRGWVESLGGCPVMAWLEICLCLEWSAQSLGFFT